MDTARPSASSSQPEFATCIPGGHRRHHSLPIIAVPTALAPPRRSPLTTSSPTWREYKFVCGPHDIPVVAIVDPDMMASMPKA
ncbi:MAG: hypothetical protein ACLU8J_12010 [Acutalibacter sp.]